MTAFTKLPHFVDNRFDSAHNFGMGNRILLLSTARTYRANAFLTAADKLGVEVVQAIDMPDALSFGTPNVVAVDFQDVAGAVATITDYTNGRTVDAVLAIDDSGALLSAEIGAALKLPFNSVAAAEAARNKLRMRQLLSAGGVACPPFRRFTSADDPDWVASQVVFPCVVKPLTLSGSRGVIRANNSAELTAGIQRTTTLLRKLTPSAETVEYLVEGYIPGVEVALEGMLDRGQLHVLALFDKPDPLVGPFFEETIYVTPSRLSAEIQTAIAATTAASAEVLGLRHGPVHAELRINDEGVWLVEIAGRSIGGLCSQTLQFGTDASLEELIVRQALGRDLGDLSPPASARGVMMIPIPAAGLLRDVDGIEQAKAVAHITDIEITAPLNHTLTPLPEGDAYLGFIFAEAPTPDSAEDALRSAHAQLNFRIDPIIPLEIR